MTHRAVHWHEGMFLRPHHFQAAQRYAAGMVAQNAKWDSHYNWGVRLIHIDPDALANFRLSVGKLQARLRDGTTVTVPEDGDLPEVDLRGAFEREPSLTVYLATPRVNLTKANTAANGQVESARYVVNTQELEDENTGTNPQSIDLRLLNLRLLLSTQPREGYEALEIARLVKGGTAAGNPQLDPSYIPPLLVCDAWQILAEGILQRIFDRIGTHLDERADSVVRNGVTFESVRPGDSLLMHQLAALNEASALLRVVAFAPGIHPLAAYTELCRLVGQLAIFGRTFRMPDLPAYDHDDLAGCFYRVKLYIDELLDAMGKPSWLHRDFIGTGLRMQVSIERDWLEERWQMFLGIASELKEDECVKMFTHGGQASLKIASADRVEQVMRGGLRGLLLEHRPNPPRTLPASGVVYFQINRESQKDEWAALVRSLTLAIRMNENLVKSDIDGQRTLRIECGRRTVPMQFTLYIVPKEMS